VNRGKGMMGCIKVHYVYVLKDGIMKPTKNLKLGVEGKQQKGNLIEVNI
jgi:hypothetical protein